MITSCPICLELLLFVDQSEQNNVVTRCGHLFHEKCLQTWISEPSSHRCCPTCYKELPYILPSIKIFITSDGNGSFFDYDSQINMDNMLRKNRKLKETIQNQETLLAEIGGEMTKTSKTTAKKVKEIKSQIASLKQTE